MFCNPLSVIQFPGRRARLAVEEDRDGWRVGLGFILGDGLGVARALGARDGEGAALVLGA